MAIYELEPKIKIGPIHIGKKLGKRVDSGLEPNADQIHEGLIRLEKGDVGVTVMGPHTVGLSYWLHNRVYGVTRTREEYAERYQINIHPIARDLVRWVE